MDSRTTGHSAFSPVYGASRAAVVGPPFTAGSKVAVSCSFAPFTGLLAVPLEHHAACHKFPLRSVQQLLQPPHGIEQAVSPAELVGYLDHVAVPGNRQDFEHV